MSKPQIVNRISELLHFEPKHLLDIIDRRLGALSGRPKRISHHTKENAYCLRYEERMAIAERNISDSALLDAFSSDTKKQLVDFFSTAIFSADEGLSVLKEILHKIFERQGLEFSEFVKGHHADYSLELSLPDIIREIVDKHALSPSDSRRVQGELLQAIRAMVYQGTESQKIFLSKLSQTYLMMFLLQCEPQVAGYFEAMASTMTVYVDASIIIPALSEFFLEPQNRRYCNLLSGASAAGVRLVVNDNIINEIVDHFDYIQSRYSEDIEGRDYQYDCEEAIAYVRQIMIRAYLYALLHKQIAAWDEFIARYVTPRGGRNIRQEVIELLSADFGISFQSDASQGVQTESAVVDSIAEEISRHIDGYTAAARKRKASNDAQVIVTVYSLREKRNETAYQGEFGYKTWWLSSDHKSYRAVKNVLGDKHPTHCYMRPDFLYNYISLAPRKQNTVDAFKKLFPSLLGVSIAYRVPEAVQIVVGKFLKEHYGLPTHRKKGILRALVDDLKSNVTLNSRERITHHLDELLRKIVD